MIPDDVLRHMDGRCGITEAHSDEDHEPPKTKRWRLSVTRTWYVDAPDNLDGEDVALHVGDEMLNVNLADLMDVMEVPEELAVREPDFVIEGPDA